MILTWRDFRVYVAADMASRRTALTPSTFLFDPLVRFTVLLRLDAYLLNTRAPLLTWAPIRLWLRRLSIRLGFSMGPNTFGPGLDIRHRGTIVVNPHARVGANCRIEAGVHIGGAAGFVALDEAHLFSPTIGKNVTLGPGAKLYGPIVVGDDCIIDANAVVTKSFPDPGLFLSGAPANIIEFPLPPPRS